MKIVESRNKYFLISVVVIAIGIIVMIFNAVRGEGAFNYDVEFSGGTALIVDIGKEFNNDEVLKIIEETTGQSGVHLQKVVGTTSANIKLKSLEQDVRIKLTDALKTKYGITNDHISFNDVSATVSGEMQSTAILAVIVACIAMLAYVSIRFRDFNTGASAIIGLIHDAAIVVVVYAILRIPLNYSFIAAVLTIIGFSINSTIIIFDRVRENKTRLGKVSHETLLNTSITQTLRRCIYTTLTTVISVTVLLVVGVPSVRDFALPIVIGIITGTYTSICLVGSVWFMLASAKKKPVAKN